jgi:hypothetical protein
MQFPSYYIYSQNGSSLPPKVALMVLLFEYSIHYSFQKHVNENEEWLFKLSLYWNSISDWVIEQLVVRLDTLVLRNISFLL